MSEGFASSTKQTNYGSTNERLPTVSIAGTKYMSEEVATNIYTINTKRKALEQCMKAVGTPKDSQELRNRVHSMLLSTNEVVDVATKDLHKLNVFVKKGGDKRQKLSIDKLTNEFKEAVTMYQRVQKLVVEKVKTHILPSEQALRDDIAQSQSNEEGESSSNLVKTMAEQLEFEKGLLIEREQMMLSIEGCVLDINQIMKEVGVMVNQQGEDINSIENAIETVYDNVEAGNTLLEKAAGYHASRQKKTFCLLGISVAAGIILAIIIAVSLSH